MRNLKKLIALVLTIGLVLSSMSVAFATSIAPAAGIEDDTIRVAVEKLSAFGIVTGKEDGKFHEEDNLTRDEFAAMLIRALNLKNAAEAAKGATAFSDVPATVWSSGYINVSTSRDIIKGRPDGTFGRLDNVTFAEAATMLVRALGYKDEWLSGKWPANMINKADEIGILDDVTFSSGAANRGAAAVMLNNALTINMVKADGFGSDVTFKVSNDTILENTLKVKKIEGRVAATPAVDSGLEADEIVLGSKTYAILQEGVSINDILGLEVILYADGTDVKYVEIDTDDANIVYGMIVDKDEITVKKADGKDKDYGIASDADLYVNREEVKASDLRVGQYGYFVLDSKGKVEFANLLSFDEAAVIVNSVNASKKTVNVIRSASSTDAKIDLDGDDGLKVIKDGTVIELDDIAEGDVIYVAKAVPEVDDDEYTYVYVVSNTAEGKLSRVRTTSVTVDGKAYDISRATALFSLNSGDDIEAFLDGGALAEGVSDAIGEEVTVYLDLAGEARYLVTDVEATAGTLYGIAVRDSFTYNGEDAVRLFTAEGKEVIYNIDGSFFDVDKGDLVKYSLNKDGLIPDDKIEVIAAGALGDDLTAADITVDEFDDDNDSIADGASTYYVDDKTIIMDFYGDNVAVANPGAVDPAVVKWADIKDKTATGVDATIVVDDDNVAKFVVFTTNYDLSSSDGYIAYVNDDPYEDVDGTMLDVTLLDGTKKSYVTTSNSGFGAKEGDFIVFETNADGEISDCVIAVSETGTDTNVDDIDSNFTMDAGTVSSYSSGIMKIGAASYRVPTSAAIYVLTLDGGDFDKAVVGDRSDIDATSTVRVILDEGVVKLVVVLDGTFVPDPDDPDDPSGTTYTYNGTYTLDSNKYVQLDDASYPYVGGTIDAGIAVGDTVTATFTTIRGETVVTSITEVVEP